MKEDILEQLVDDYLQFEGYFTRHNIKFRPRRDHSEFDSKKDSNHSDVDVIGYHPTPEKKAGVVVVTCKSWQNGFNPRTWLTNIQENKTVSGREAWQTFRELVKPKWAEALIDKVEELTGSRRFTYTVAVTAIIGDRAVWEKHRPFVDMLGGNRLRLIDLNDMLGRLDSESTTTVASSQIGRILQLMKAAKKGRKPLLDTVEAQGEDEE
jgi:hypothetical protein